jgi:hypothetical protein
MSLYEAVRADLPSETNRCDLVDILQAADAEASRYLRICALNENPSDSFDFVRNPVRRLAEVIDPDWGKDNLLAEALLEQHDVDGELISWQTVLTEAAFRLGMAIGARIGGAR